MKNNAETNYLRQRYGTLWTTLPSFLNAVSIQMDKDGHKSLTSGLFVTFPQVILKYLK